MKKRDPIGKMGRLERDKAVGRTPGLQIPVLSSKHNHNVMPLKR